ncbi:MAG: molecular chaperone DnaK [Alphaproteobacteria bacterium CG_4_10_14_0_2_um_filter_63_37]|nr:MAG: hypothetical protein AUJ55_07455 [Proteobacteria bacterium CG1_02_64_396]PJA24485.1 MAG: molecular chaperone DnaK [Alphaproteobacteria bacterium CG_4_10_14_0_2_um_filter_63_37]
MTIFEIYRQTLLTEQTALLEGIARLKESGRTVALDQTLMGRLSRMDALQQQAMAQAGLARSRVRLRAIEAALQRLEDRVYGICCECGEPVEPQRLGADPATPFCQECLVERG